VNASQSCRRRRCLCMLSSSLSAGAFLPLPFASVQHSSLFPYRLSSVWGSLREGVEQRTPGGRKQKHPSLLFSATLSTESFHRLSRQYASIHLLRLFALSMSTVIALALTREQEGKFARTIPSSLGLRLLKLRSHPSSLPPPLSPLLRSASMLPPELPRTPPERRRDERLATPIC
jgi:hypothetical protein